MSARYKFSYWRVLHDLRMHPFVEEFLLSSNFLILTPYTEWRRKIWMFRMLDDSIKRFGAINCCIHVNQISFFVVSPVRMTHPRRRGPDLLPGALVHEGAGKGAIHDLVCVWME